MTTKTVRKQSDFSTLVAVIIHVHQQNTNIIYFSLTIKHRKVYHFYH